MKTFLYTFSIILIALISQSCSFNTTRGNGNISENEVAISDYNEIHFSGGASLIYEQKKDATPYLRIEVDENIFPLLLIESKEGVLSIKNKENIKPTKYNIYTNSASLSQISASGSLKTHLKGILETDDLKIQLSGSGNIVADNLICHSINTGVSGSGDIKLSGKASEINSHISGSGKIDAMDMPADTVICSVSGSGNFSVHAEKYLKISVSGSGDVKYKGNPEIDKSISGSGKVIKVD